MASNRDYFLNAQLALASYAVYSERTRDKEQLIEELTKNDGGASFTATQAAAFAARYEVVDHQENLPDGFSGTLFWDKVANKYVLAIRGTEPLNDPDIFDADTDIALRGIAFRQIASLYNWFQELITPAGQPAKSITLNTFDSPRSAQDILLPSGKYLSLDRIAPGLGRGLLASGQTLDITGHSLGGHLALAFARLFPEFTNHVYTYNAPGFKVGETWVEGFLDSVAEGPSSFPPDDKVSNLFANEALEQDDPGFTAIAGLHTLPGGEPDAHIYIEAQGPGTTEPEPPGAKNHSQMVLTDSLALHDLIAELAPSVDQPMLDSIFNAAAHQSHRSLESVLAALRRLFVGSGDPYGQNPLMGNAAEAREAFYANLTSLREHASFVAAQGAVSIVSLAGKNATEIEALAKGDIAYRYALKELNPFAITGNAALYAPYQVDLSLFNPADGTGNVTDQWLTDRSHVLSQLLRRNTADSILVVDSGAGKETYVDLAAGLVFSTAEVGYIGPDLPPDSRRYIFGGVGNDTNIQGGDLGDRLYGGGGNDTLSGTTQNDLIFGESGNDTLYAQGSTSNTLTEGAANDAPFDTTASKIHLKKVA